MWYSKPLSNNNLLIGLIFSCLLILSCFLGWWLNRSYTEQKRLLAAETSQAFFRSVMGLQDSLFTLRVIRPSNRSHHPDSMRFHFRIDSPNGRFHSPPHRRLNFDTDEFPQQTHRRTIVRVLPSRSLNRIFLNKSPDSIRTGTISYKFRHELDSLHLAVRFKVIRSSTEPAFGTDTLRTSAYQAGFPPIDFYYAELQHYRSFIWKRMIPHGIFSVFLLGLTSAAFLLIFRSLKQQQRLTELKNDFISNMTHELKTPIATVSVAIEALSSFDALKNPKRTQEYLDISKTELSRLNLLIDKVLKTTTFDQAQLAYQFETVDLQTLTQKVLNSLEVQFEKLRAEVSFTVTGDSWMIWGDEVHLMNVWYNLIDNALKYSTDSPNITLSLKHHEDTVSLQVRDSGMGIAPEFQEKVFEKFFRVPTGNVHTIKGYGLGLNYVSQVIRAHQGTIGLQSEPGTGSVFTLTLPAVS